MYIRVFGLYQGKPSGERVILPGTYAITDKKLFGLADYLVQNGHAEEISPETIPDPLPFTEPAPAKKRGRPRKVRATE